MPTRESWINETNILVEWSTPLKSGELYDCFVHVADMVSDSAQYADILFDISDAGHIPVDSPMQAVRSGFLNHSKARNVAVIGPNQWGQVLARIASRTSGKLIVFYQSYDEAARALQLTESVIT